MNDNIHYEIVHSTTVYFSENLLKFFQRISQVRMEGTDILFPS